MNLLFLESQKDINKADKLIFDKTIKKIALTPEAMFELEKLKVDFSIPENYCDEKEVFNFGIENYKKVEKFLNILDKQIVNNLAFFKENKLKPGFFSFYCFKTCYDNITVNAFRLVNVFKKEQPTKVFFIKKPEISSDNFSFSNSVYCSLIDLLCDRFNAVKEIISKEELENVQVKKNLKPEIKNLVKKFYFKAISFFSSKEIIFLKTGNELKPLFDVLASSKAFVWEVKDRADDSLNLDFLDDFFEKKDIKKFFKIGEIDLIEVFLPKLKAFKKIIRRCAAQAKLVLAYFTKNKPKLILTTTSHYPWQDSMISQIAQKFNIPTVSYQHGGEGCLKRSFDKYYEVQRVDYYFVWGEGTENNYKNINKKADVIPIGSIVLDELKRKNLNKEKILRKYGLDLNKKVVFYAPTNFWRNDLYVSESAHFSDNLYFKQQRQIIDLLSKFKNVQFIIKLHPVEKLENSAVVNYIRWKNYLNIKVILDMLVEDRLAIADIFIADKLSSTTLMQYVCSDKKIFLFIDNPAITKQALKAIKKRMVFSTKFNDFEKKLTQIIEDNDFGNEFKDDSFLRLYGTYLNNGKSSERVLNFVKEITKESE